MLAMISEFFGAWYVAYEPRRLRKSEFFFLPFSPPPSINTFSTTLREYTPISVHFGADAGQLVCSRLFPSRIISTFSVGFVFWLFASCGGPRVFSTSCSILNGNDGHNFQNCNQFCTRGQVLHLCHTTHYSYWNHPARIQCWIWCQKSRHSKHILM